MFIKLDQSAFAGEKNGSDWEDERRSLRWARETAIPVLKSQTVQLNCCFSANKYWQAFLLAFSRPSHLPPPLAVSIFNDSLRLSVYRWKRGGHWLEKKIPKKFGVVKCKFASGRFMANLKAVKKHKKHIFKGAGGGRWKTGWQEERGQGVGRKGSEECERLGGLWPGVLKGLDEVEGKTKPHHQCCSVIALKIPH